MTGIDLRQSEPRGPHECLGGVKLLARLVDKGWASILGTNGSYVYYDCPLDHVFFDALKATGDDLIAVLKDAFRSSQRRNIAALVDLRESLQSEPEISDETFLIHATASDLDNAAVWWVQNHLRTPPGIIAMINTSVDQLPPQAFNDRCQPPGSVA
jgi:hypothetical protein